MASVTYRVHRSQLVEELGEVEDKDGNKHRTIAQVQVLELVPAKIDGQSSAVTIRIPNPTAKQLAVAKGDAWTGSFGPAKA